MTCPHIASILHPRSSKVMTLALACIFLARCAPAQSPPEAPSPGIIVQPDSQGSAKYWPWKTEETLQQALTALGKNGGGTISFLPGRYEIHQGFSIRNLENITIRGTDGVQLYFAPGPKSYPKLTQEAQPGVDFLRVDKPDQFKIGWKYQVYREDRKGDRLLEFKVDKLGADRIWISPRVRFMGHVDTIPAGSIILEHVNFFNISQCNSIVLDGLHLDGKQRGNVHGHTTFCGVLAVGKYKAGERPKNHGLYIKNCSFRGLKGRGVAAYGMGEVVIEGSYFSDIDSQAMEIDHFSSGAIRFNEVHGSGVGIALNDAFDSVVTGNTILDCPSAITLVKHFDNAWVNSGNLIDHNVIINAKRTGISFSHPMSGNTIRGNYFVGMAKDKWVTNGSGNTILDSSKLP